MVFFWKNTLVVELIIWVAEVFCGGRRYGLWPLGAAMVANTLRDRERERIAEGKGGRLKRESGLRFGEGVRYMFWGYALD